MLNSDNETLNEKSSLEVLVERIRNGLYGLLFVMGKGNNLILINNLDTASPEIGILIGEFFDFFQLMSFPFSERIHFPWNHHYVGNSSFNG
jgi:hypothetical protein